MASEAERQVVNITPPEQSDTPGEGVTILAATTTAASAAIPAGFAYRYVYIQAEGDKIWVAFGAAASPDVDRSAAGGADFTAGTDETHGVPIPNGNRIPVRIDPKRHAYLKWQADSTASKLVIYPTTPGARGA
jgi:hypothetical protein